MPTNSDHGPRSLGRTGPRFLASRQRVLDADQICHLCGELIDMDLKYPDPMSATVDHIIPDSQLSRDDPRHWDPRNLKPAHLRCNSRRGTGAHKVEHPNSLIIRGAAVV